jgi:hypothetical protein
MRERKPTNPFYVTLLPVGAVFGITACAYTVMAYLGRDPHRTLQGGLPGLMEQHGLAIMVVELAVLGVLTIAAIGTDDFWTRRFEAAQRRKNGSSQEMAGPTESA